MPWGVSGDDQKRSDSGSFDCDRSVKTTPRKNRAGIYWEEQVSVGGKNQELCFASVMLDVAAGPLSGDFEEVIIIQGRGLGWR